MSEIAIRVEGLSKLYRLGARQRGYRTLRESLTDAVAAPFRRLSRNGNSGANGGPETIWALKDVSFEVKRGEVLGIIGRNGAGKSTLLKVLARITDPTTGFAELHGRVGSLLEVGTGFHPELTGRENIYLSGAILGMRREEIDRKFDEIVAFAEIDKFVDTPVKQFSSGMYLRLAFAVAAHLEPEILLVDEVLAVGDAVFQQKCIGRMNEIAEHGRTVLFVSHNLAAVRDLCTASVVVHQGGLRYHGATPNALAVYSRLLKHDVGNTASATRWLSISAGTSASESLHTYQPGCPLHLNAELRLADGCQSGFLVAVLEDAMGNTYFNNRIAVDTKDCPALVPGPVRIALQLDEFWPRPGSYNAQFKFIGVNPDGSQTRVLSDRVFIDVPGSSDGIGRSLVVPPCQWMVLQPPPSATLGT